MLQSDRRLSQKHRDEKPMAVNPLVGMGDTSLFAGISMTQYLTNRNNNARKKIEENVLISWLLVYFMIGCVVFLWVIVVV